MTTIPASAIVQVTPSVLAAGGRALDIIGLLLSTSTRIPIGTVQPFPDAATVSDYFGPLSTEAAMAAIYFQGFDNSNVKPEQVLMAQYNTASVAAWLRGGTLGITLQQLQAIPVGSLQLFVNGTTYTAASVNLGSAVSFSGAAGIINTAFGGTGAIPFVCTYDSIAGAFYFQTNATGTGASIGYMGTSSLASTLLLTQATGAVISQGALAATPSAFMQGITNITQDWATFTTLFDPDGGSGNTQKLLFAEWNATQNNRWAYVVWDPDLAPRVTVPATQSLGQLLVANGISGTCVISSADATKAVFVCGAGASIDFTETNGRITFAFKSQSGLAADVTDALTASNLEANGYNYYGAWATANDSFLFFYPGTISGQFRWLDSYINQIWLNNGFQLELMELLISAKSIPYNQQGYNLIEAACMDQILAGLNFGAFRAGVTLSQAQAAEVNSDAGVKIDNTLNERGWYLQVKDAAPEVRQARGSPPCTFWYMDGESVQRINLASIDLL